MHLCYTLCIDDFDTDTKGQNLKTVKDYPKMLSIKEAVDMAVTLFPERYPDPAKARNTIRNNALRGGIPGARAVELAGQQLKTWQYDRDKLFKWLADPENHKAGRKPGRRPAPKRKPKEDQAGDKN